MNKLLEKINTIFRNKKINEKTLNSKKSILTQNQRRLCEII